MLTEPQIDPETLQRIKIPVLVTAGENDLVLRSETELIGRSIPDAETVILAGEDHDSYIADSDVMGKLLIDFFARKWRDCRKDSAKMSATNRLFRMAQKMKPDPEIRVRKAKTGHVPLLILQPKGGVRSRAALLWIHGGGYFLGMKEMVYMSRASDLVKKYGVTVISPGYTLAWQSPYPAALKDCYRALLWIKKNADRLGIDDRQIMVGGESAGGGLTAALCILAKDRSKVRIAWQFPLYPMLSSQDTESSRDNHGHVWNTRRNHFGWKLYLRQNAGKSVSSYASPAFREDLKGLPPAYTFVGDGEPFYAETLEYIRCLKEAGVEAEVDVYHSDIHAFDMLRPGEEPAQEAIRKFEKKFEYALEEIGAER